MKKGQAAMEFLMTYGWAILVVLAAIGALAYFGVLNPSNLMPAQCKLGSGFDCSEFKVTVNNVQINLLNNIGYDLKDVTLTMNGTSGSDCDASIAIGELKNGEKTELQNFACAPDISGSKFKANLVLVYTRSDQSVSHTTTGTIVGNVEE